MRVVFLTHYYPPEAGAPQTRISTLARGLADRGFEVTVHTGLPNYPTGRIQPPYRNRPLLREPDGAVRVIRTAVVPTANRGFAPRLANHLGFAASSTALAAASGPQDVVVVETPPLFLAAAGVGYARIKRAPLIVNVADLWPASAVELGVLTDRRAIAVAERLERWIYRSAAAVTAPTRGIVRTLDAGAGSAGKAAHMPPFVDASRFDPEPPGRRTGPLRVLYAGTVGLAQGVGTLLDAAAAAGDAVEVTIAGSGPEEAEVRRRVAAERLANVRLAGIVSAAEVPGLYRAADAGVVLLRDRPIFAEALPTKLLECMAAGRPVVLSARGEAAELVEAAGAGIVTPPEDAGALAGALRALGADPERAARLGLDGRRFVEAGASATAAVDRWAGLLERVAAQPRLNAA